MEDVNNIKNDFIKAGYTEEEAIILEENAIKFKSTVADITLDEAIEFLKQAYDTMKL